MSDEPRANGKPSSGRFGGCFENFRSDGVETPEVKDIDIVVPVYGGLEFLPAFFDSLFDEFPEQSRLIIIDDANHDPVLLAYLDTVKTRLSDALILRNAENLGFTGSVNRGLRASRSHAVILNTDIELPRGWANRLLAPILADPDRVASVTPFTNAGTICSFPYPNKDGRMPYDLPASVIDSIFSRFHLPEPAIEIPTGVGFCMALSRHALDTIGVFDEETFARGYGEENDWCMKARAAGLINVHALNLFVAHRDGGSFSNAEKRALNESHSKLLRARHPTYRDDVHAYIGRNRLEPIRSTIAATLCLLEKSRRIKVLITFARGGGSHYYASRLVAETLATGESIIQAAILSGSNDVRLDIFTPDDNFQFGTGTFEDLSIFFERFDIAEVIVNQLYVSADPERIIQFLRSWKALNSFRVKFLLHDFFSVCPGTKLLGGDGAFCGVPDDLAVCDSCLASSTFDSWNYMPKLVSMQPWRAAWRAFFDEVCDDVVFFSASSKEIFLRAYPDPRCNLRFHPHKAYNDHALVPVSTALDRLRIGVFGDLSIAKGAEVIRRLCAHIDANGLPIEVHHFGKHSLDINTGCYEAHGPYLREHVSTLINSTGVNVALLPSIWPETFSFVLDELMLLGLPVVSFNLGAPAERTRRYAKGLVLTSFEPSSVADALQNFFTRLRRDHL